MEFLKSFFADYGFTIIYAAVTAIAAFIGTKIKAIYQDKVNDEAKEKIVRTCVTAAEQLYKTYSGTEKLEAVKSNVVQMLNAKGIDISEIEMDMLIESVVAELNLNDLKITKKESDDNGNNELAVG